MCASKSVYLNKSSYSLKVYRFACAHFMYRSFPKMETYVINKKIPRWYPDQFSGHRPPWQHQAFLSTLPSPIKTKNIFNASLFIYKKKVEQQKCYMSDFLKKTGLKFHLSQVKTQQLINRSYNTTYIKGQEDRSFSYLRAKNHNKIILIWGFDSVDTFST